MATRPVLPPGEDIDDTANQVTASIVLKSAWSIFKAYPTSVVVPGVAVFAVATALDMAGAELEKRHHLPTIDVAFTVGFLLSLIGIVFYTGLLDHLVEKRKGGHEPSSVYEVMKTLPYLTLIGANFVLVALETLTSSFFVLPGLVAITLLCVSGPVINHERNGLFVSLWRSVCLVLPNFWIAFALVTVPLIIQSELVTVLYAILATRSVYLQASVVLLVGIVLGIAVGLVEVALGDLLMENDAL